METRQDEGTAPGPTRRAALGLGLGLGLIVPVAALAGCRVRLEDDAPRVPGVPTREPTEDEALLLQAWRDAGELGRTASALGAPGALAARLHRAHLAVLRQELDDRRVPAALRSPSPSATPTSAPPRPTARSLATAEAGALAPAALAALGSVHSTRAALLGSLTACRARLAAGLGVPATWPAWTTRPTPVDAALVEAHREARALLEVAAARTPRTRRGALARELDRVDGVVVRLESRAPATTPPSVPSAPSSSSASGPSSGTAPQAAWPLPFAVTDEAGARRLAGHALRGLEQRLGTLWPQAAGSPDGVLATTRLVAEASAAGASWGLPLRPWPGLAT